MYLGDLRAAASAGPSSNRKYVPSPRNLRLPQTSPPPALLRDTPVNLMPDRLRVVPPHDQRYGRLFPDGDVGNILAALLSPEDLANVDLDKLGARFTFPVGEPMFLLRAGDPHALAALEAHRDACADAPEYQQDVERAILAFRKQDSVS